MLPYMNRYIRLSHKIGLCSDYYYSLLKKMRMKERVHQTNRNLAAQDSAISR